VSEYTPAQKTRVGDAIKDATAPLRINDNLAKLCRQYGTERVLVAVKAWVAFIERVSQ
jgi:hypothetical protein